MCTAQSQKFLPDFLTNLDGTSVSVPGDPDYVGPGGKTGVEVPLGDAVDQAQEISIKVRRRRIRQAQEAEKQRRENPGSHKPTPVRSRKDILEEIT